MTEQKIAQIFEQVGLAKIVRELANDELMNAVQSAMIAIAQEQPSLPEGLDEAAEEQGKTKFYTRADDFKAGAEWMAGQAKKDLLAIVKEYMERGDRCMQQAGENGEQGVYTFWDGFHNCAENLLRELEK